MFMNIQLLLWGRIMVALLIDAVSAAVTSSMAGAREEGK